MNEIPGVKEIRVKHMIWAWDGRVMEVFGLVGNPGLRYHADQLNYEVKDHRGKIRVGFNSPIQMTVELEPQDWPEVQAFLAEIKPPAS